MNVPDIRNADRILKFEKFFGLQIVSICKGITFSLLAKRYIPIRNSRQSSLKIAGTGAGTGAGGSTNTFIATATVTANASTITVYYYC